MDGQQFVTWIAVAGSSGGVLNAAASGNLFLWPLRVPNTGTYTVIRPGLIANIAIGASAPVGAILAFGTHRLAVSDPIGDVVAALMGALVIGLIAARWVTNESDKRLLRAAVAKACVAPAAHPDTAKLVEIASPDRVFNLACELVPRLSGARRDRR